MAISQAAVGRAPIGAVLSAPYRWTTITIIAGTVVGSMDSYIVNTSMPRVLAELGQPEFYAWVASAFILASVVGLAVGGAWMDRSGIRVPFLASVAAFGISSAICAAAPSMSVLVLARAVQGLSGGVLNAVGFAAAASYPDRLRLRMFSLVSGAWGIIALTAPLLGGFITDTLGWRWIFLVNLPVCALVILLGWLALAASSPSSPRRSLPILRAVLLAVAVAGITAAPSAGLEFGLPILAVGVVSAFVFAHKERGALVPIIPREVWTARGPVGSSLLATAFYTGAFIGASVFVPLYLVEVRGQTTTQAGLVLSISGFMWTAGTTVAAARGSGAWPMRMVVSGALLITLGGLYIAGQTALGGLPIPLIYVAWAMAGFGVGLAMLHLMNWAIAFSPREQTGTVSGAVQTVRMLGSAIAGALMGAILNAIGTDPGHLQQALIAIFLMVAILGVIPATILRPKIPSASPLP